MSVQAPALGSLRNPTGPDGMTPAVFLVLGTAAYIALGILGRLTLVDGAVLSLVWPAAGISMLMLALVDRRSWPLVAVLVAAATYGLNVVTGADSETATVFVVSNVIQALVGVLFLQALAPHLLGAGGGEPLARMRDFWVVLGTCLVASLAGAAVGSTGFAAFVVDWSLIDSLVWWGRNTAGSLVVLGTAVLLLERWAEPSVAVRRLVLRRLRSQGVELGLLVGLTVVLYLSVFVWWAAVPLAFPLLLPTVWVGLRFSPVTVALHGAGVGVAVLAFTLAGMGPFANTRDWYQEALVCELFVAMTFSLGLLLSINRAERLALVATVSTARARSEGQALMMSAVIESMHDGLSLVDGDGRVLMRNEAGTQMTHADGLSDTRVSQYVMTDTSGRELGREELPQLRVFHGDGVLQQDVVLRFTDGSPSRTLAISGRRLPARDGGPADRAVLVYHDVTEDRAQRTALESFAGVVAHDLLGPLGVVDGWAELLASDLAGAATVPTSAITPKLARIRTAAAGMHRLISDLLESSTARDRALRSTVVDLTAVARSVAEQRSSVAVGEPPRIEVGELPAAYADAAMVRQVIDNLVGNAVKYVSPGEVPEVSVTGRRDGPRVEVTVADHGIGIPVEQRDAVFEAFSRGTATETYAGHGIGLAVCRRIVERHGGTITSRTPPDGRGTRIVFTLPAVDDDSDGSVGTGA